MAKRVAYDVSLKLKAVEYAEKTSKEAAARHFSVDAKRIREWCGQKDQLLEMTKSRGKKKRKRLTGGGRKALDSDMEEALFSWIIDLRSRNLRVSRKMIRQHARSISTTADFKASVGWLRRFMKRHSLSLRRKTTVCQNTPADCIPKLVSFVIHLRKEQIRHSYELQNIYAMDETACWFDMPSDTTVALTGARSVPLKTTGHEKDHYTVILTARADGMKMKPFVVFKGKGTRLIKDLKKIPGIVVCFSANGWMNDALTIKYLQDIIGVFSFNRRLLVWDAYRCHTSEAVRAETKRLRLHTAIVPGGCTKFIQAADVVWNTCFKSKIRSHYDTWLSDPTCHQFTRGGNLKAPSRSLLCDWVKSAWNSVPVEMVKDSFTSCAITTTTDGSKDSEIHCFKPGQPCADGRDVLKEEARKLSATDGMELDDDMDPFAEEMDEEETENNEAFVEYVSDEETEVEDDDCCSETSGDED